MGANTFIHTFKHYDWRMGIRELQAEAERMYGHQEGYSGQINCVDDFRLHRPNRAFRNMNEVYDYVEERLERISKREGEVIDLGIEGYSIAKPVVREYYGFLNIDPRDLRNTKEPAILVNQRGFVEARGTVAELKERAKKLVMKQKFEFDYFIVGKNTNKIYIVTGEGKRVKSTTKKSDEKQLVLPYHHYIVYGVAPY